MRVFALGSVVATARFLGGLLLYLISPLNELDGGEVGTRVGLIVNLLPAVRHPTTMCTRASSSSGRR